MVLKHTIRCKLCGEQWNPRKGSVASWIAGHLRKKHGIKVDKNVAEAQRKYFETIKW